MEGWTEAWSRDLEEDDWKAGPKGEAGRCGGTLEDGHEDGQTCEVAQEDDQEARQMGRAAQNGDQMPQNMSRSA